MSKLNPSNLFKGRRQKKKIKLEVIASRMDEIQREKKQLDGRLDKLEDRSGEIESALIQTLDLTNNNQERLDSIEESMQKLIEMSSRLVKQDDSVPEPASPAGESVKAKPDKPAA